VIAVFARRDMEQAAEGEELRFGGFAIRARHFGGQRNCSDRERDLTPLRVPRHRPLVQLPVQHGMAQHGAHQSTERPADGQPSCRA
jgi:hypothetical protein